MTDEEETPDAIVLLAILVEGGLIATAWVVGWILDQPPLLHFKWTAVDAAWGVAATVPMLVLFFLMNRWPLGALAEIKNFTDKVLRPLLAPCGLLDLLGIAILAGLGEEMLFRGVFQVASARYLPAWMALVLASVLFGIVHAVTALYAFLAMLSGLYLGWLFNQTDNLLAPVITHALYDFVVLVYVMRGPGSDVIEPEEGEGEGLQE